MGNEALASNAAVPYPIARASLFDPPEEFKLYREQSPIVPLKYPNGATGWLITGDNLARKFLNSPLIKHSFASTFPADGNEEVLAEAGPGEVGLLDPPDHSKLRRLLASDFSVSKIAAWSARIEDIVNRHLDGMAAAGGPADLVADFALPMPTLVISDYLGIPPKDRLRVYEPSNKLVSGNNSSVEEVGQALQDLKDLMREVVELRRVQPGEDLVSRLLANDDVSDDEIIGLGWTLIVAGHETTANMIALGMFALLQRPDQLQLLRDDPSLITSTVEELLRYLTIPVAGVTMKAREDLDLDGHLIKAGEDVTVSLQAANRDPEQCREPDRLDITRTPNRHLAFSHGAHNCVGQHLARLEMKIAIPALLRRFPDLRLAVPAESIPMRHDMRVYGVYSLPVSWGSTQ